MAKETTKKKAPNSETKKPLKKIRSFNLDERVYNGLMDILETSGTQTNLSALIDEFLRKLYIYLLEAEGVIEKNKTDLPLSYVIYDCLNTEYFRELNKKNTRIQNLIWSHEASKRGLSLMEFLEIFEHEALINGDI